MTEQNPLALAERFQADRTRLVAVAYRMLGSRLDAEDAVQEVWLRLQGSDDSIIDNLSGWLTTVTARLCLDRLRARLSRPEDPAADVIIDSPNHGTGGGDPLDDALLAESVGAAVLLVLDRLTPAERVAFVLHDVFGVSFDEIAPVLDRTVDASRQLASRARRRVQAGASPVGVDLAHHREVVQAFLTAARTGNMSALVELLDPDIVVRADDDAVRLGAPAEAHGPDSEAIRILGQARGARSAVVGGVPGAAWVVQGQVRVAFAFAVAAGRVREVALIADPDRIRALDVVLLDASP